MGEATAAALERMGARVAFPQEQWCCGLVLSNAGDRGGAKRLARQTIQVLEAAGDVIVSNSASCVVAIQQDYQDLFRDEPAWQQRAATVGQRLMDFTSFLDRYLTGAHAAGLRELLKKGRGAFPEALEGTGWASKVTYHDSCQSYNCLGLYGQGRRVLKEVLGRQVSEMRDSAVCCGFGGSFSVDYPEVAGRVLRRKLDNIEATGARTVVTDNPGCILHLRGGLHARDKNVQVLHLAELLAEALGRAHAAR